MNQLTERDRDGQAEVPCLWESVLHSLDTSCYVNSISLLCPLEYSFLAWYHWLSQIKTAQPMLVLTAVYLITSTPFLSISGPPMTHSPLAWFFSVMAFGSQSSSVGICWHKCTSACSCDKRHCFRSAQELMWLTKGCIFLWPDKAFVLLEPSKRQHLPSPQLTNGSSALQRSASHSCQPLWSTQLAEGVPC